LELQQLEQEIDILDETKALMKMKLGELRGLESDLSDESDCNFEDWEIIPENEETK
jgi:hypothetical protein